MEKTIAIYLKLLNVHNNKYLCHISLLSFSFILYILYHAFSLYYGILFCIVPVYLYSVKYNLKGAIFSITLVNLILLSMFLHGRGFEANFIFHAFLGNSILLLFSSFILMWKKIVEWMYYMINERTIQIIPICAKCKKIRKKDDKWESIEQFLNKMGISKLTHGYCPECYEDILNDFL